MVAPFPLRSACRACGHHGDEALGSACPACGAPLVDAASLAAAPDDPLLGRPFGDGRYTVVARLGAGAEGAVYRAIQASVNRAVALKVVRSGSGDPMRRERFFREAQALSKLSHRNSVMLFDFGQEADGLTYIVEELAPGTPLDALIEREAPLEPRRAVFIAVQVLEALAEAHAQGIVHRDIKPSNVMVDTGDQVKVLDFGVARLTEHVPGRNDLTGAMPVGTPLFMAPEQTRAEQVSPTADLYAVGAMLFVMLTGRPPYDGESAIEIMFAHREQPIPDLDPGLGVPLALENAMRHALAKQPERRPSSAEALRDALVDAMTGARSAPATSAPPLAVPPPPGAAPSPFAEPPPRPAPLRDRDSVVPQSVVPPAPPPAPLAARPGAAAASPPAASPRSSWASR
ncbi:MAG: serine/threonine protein kinase [Myxococcales bacterium]|nr:serine/threonine protein kinase [Myxococcales bacterium]